MKKVAILILTSLFFMVGCQDDNSILEPSNEVAGNLNKGRVILGSGSSSSDVSYNDASKTLTIVSKNFTVDGAKGGRINSFRNFFC